MAHVAGWRLIAGAALLTFVTGVAYGQSAGHAARAEVRATRTSQPPAIDGHLNDEMWRLAEPATGFTQRDPDEGRPPTSPTEIRFLYDDGALYIAARMTDSDVTRRLTERDQVFDADNISIFLDPMHDHLTGAVFRVSAANVQEDSILYNDTWQDDSWDAVWQSAVAVDERGWSAEIRIPLSQLRFPAGNRHTWGVNVARYVRRRNENDWLEMVPKNESGTASRMAHLTGLDGLNPSRRLELLPYTVMRGEFITPAKSDNPFNDGARAFGAAGVDVKWGLTSNLTVNATVNPDFGQVEVDPAVVNLSAFETFFDEKRPFFLEGSQIFNYGRTGSNDFWGFNTTEPSLFYSRRIGRAPQLSAPGDFADPPTATTILGAVKLTGKTAGGWNIALLEAVTSQEEAQTRTSGARGEAIVEPATNYVVARLQREFGGRAGVGMLATSVVRRLHTDALRSELTDHAHVVGGDSHLFLDADREWVITGSMAASHVTGTEAVLARLQRASARYYQRPDAAHVTFDPTRTSLSGYSGRINLNRNSGLKKVNAALWGVSPGFESNDLGFHSTGDRGGAHAVFHWSHVTPGRFSRDRRVWVAKYWTWNFARELQQDGWRGAASITFPNYWDAGTGVGVNRSGTFDDRLTRGGPSVAMPAGGYSNSYLNSDNRKPVAMSTYHTYNWRGEHGWSRHAGLTLTFKPSAMVSISTGPEWSRWRIGAQYVRTVEDASATDTYGNRYVFGALAQQQWTMTTRVNVILSPKVSIRVFAQPLLSVGDYSAFKQLAQARAYSFITYGATAGILDYDDPSRMYTADPDGGAGIAAPFTFDNPDFNFKSLRVNAVFRWEIKPGSNLYAVWTRQQQDTAHPGTSSIGRDTRALFSAPGDDVVMIKLAYWLGR